MNTNIQLDSSVAQRLVNFLKELKGQISDEISSDDDIVESYNPKIEEFFDSLTKGYSCVKAKLSRQERSSQNLTSNSFQYGEIPFRSLTKIFNIIQKKHKLEIPEGGTFYDLGSGVGKGVIAVSLIHAFDYCVGIELLDSLYKTSLELLNKFNENKQAIKNQITKIPQVQLIKDDLTKFDWSDGTFIYASSTCFDPILMESMCQKALLLEKNSYFISLTKPLKPEDQWNLLDQFKIKTSWGEATIYIQIKKNSPILFSQQIQ